MTVTHHPVLSKSHTYGTLPPHDQHAAAHHEVGHLIAGRYFDCPTGGISITADQRPGHSGACWVRTGGAEVAVRIVVCMAGPAAERRYAQHCGQPLAADMDRFDQQRIAALAAAHSLTAADLACLKMRTTALIDEHWPTINKLAAAVLQRRGALGASEIDHLLEKEKEFT